MATVHTPRLPVEISLGTDDREERDRTRRLSEHFDQVSARYRTLRELDLGAVRVISDAVARTADPGRPVRLLDVATGSGRYLDAVSDCLASTLARKVVPIGLDLSPAMLTHAHLQRIRGSSRAASQPSSAIVGAPNIVARRRLPPDLFFEHDGGRPTGQSQPPQHRAASQERASGARQDEFLRELELELLLKRHRWLT